MTNSSAAQLTQIVSNGMALYEPETTAKVIDLNTMHLPTAERCSYDKPFLQIENPWRASDLARQLVFAPRSARLAAELLGVNGVRLYPLQEKPLEMDPLSIAPAPIVFLALQRYLIRGIALPVAQN